MTGRPGGFGATRGTRLRAAFFGTPDFAATVLKALLSDASPVEVVLVVTQPDRPAGRSLALQPPPVKSLASLHHLPVRQPVSVRRPATIEAIAAAGAEVAIVVAYGRILPIALLDAFPHGCLNVHASLLPRWRGAWPIGAAIRAGDAQTGVTIMRLDAGMDTGPILASRAVPLAPDASTEGMTGLMAATGASLLLDVLPGYLQGSVVPVPQPDHGATWCKQVTKADGAIDWTAPAVEVERHVRAMDDWPGAWTLWGGRRLVVRRAEVSGEASTGCEADLSPGTVVVSGKQVTVATGEGRLALQMVQLEGRAMVDATAFARGQRSFAGAILGR